MLPARRPKRLGQGPRGRDRIGRRPRERQIRARRGLPLDAAYWYPKRAPTFSDALAAVGAELWRAEAFATSRSDPEGTKIPAGLLERLLLVACRPP